MNGDDDIAAALPRPPLPAPARREAAIGAAMRRFDSEDARAPVRSGGREAARAAPWRLRPAYAWAGTLAGGILVALIALPLAWNPPDGLSTKGRIEPGGKIAGEAPRPDPVIAAAGTDPARRPANRTAESSAGTVAPADPGRRAAAQERGEILLAEADTMQPGPRAAEPSAGILDKAAEPSARAREARQPEQMADRDVTVTGSRIARPGLVAAAPVTTVSEDEADSNIIVTGSGTDRARAAGRGDWNACTVDDPQRSLGGCRKLVNPAARGTAGQASAHVAEGLALAWQGDVEEAIQKFDLAIGIAPRSSFAYLNRGLAWRRMGDLDRALADLDRAVQHGPTAARVYYNRSRIFRERGDVKRARLDEVRARHLDPSYDAVVPGP